MKIWKRFLALSLSAAMALSLLACGAGDSPEESPSPRLDATSTDAGSQESGSILDGAAAPEIVADLTQGALEFSAGVSPTDTMLTVNGEDVQADLFLYILTMNAMNMQNYLSYFGMTMEDVADTLMEESVSITTYHVLLRQKAAELGCLPTDAQNAEIQDAMAQADLPANAPYYGLTDKAAEFIFAMNIYYDNVLQAVTHEPTQEELDQYITDQGVFAVKHILLKTTDDSENPLPEEEIAAKKTLADDLLAQLQAAAPDQMPALFDELMQANSDDGGLESNPDGYVFSNDDSLVGGFREAALELEEGQLSGIVETDYGYHIMLRLPLTEENRAEYELNYRPDLLEDIVAQWVDEAEVSQSDALNNLNVAQFYNRLSAYQKALAESQNEDSGQESETPAP